MAGGCTLSCRRDYQDSAAGFAGHSDVDNLYNYGNALAKMGEFEAAIGAYDRVLEIDPGRRGCCLQSRVDSKSSWSNRMRKAASRVMSSSRRRKAAVRSSRRADSESDDASQEGTDG